MEYKTYDIKLGYSCNDKCVHCVVEKLRDEAQKNKHPDLKTQEYKHEIDNIQNKNFRRVILTGGEPTIRKDFVELVDYIKSRNLEIYLQTNGRFLSNLELAKKVENKIHTYIIALHGPNETIHDIVTQSSNSFNQTVKGIQNIVSLNQNVCGKTVISKLNYQKLLETLKIYLKLGVKEIYFAYPHSSGEDNYLQKIAPSYTQLKPYIQDVLDYAEKNNIDVKLESILPCNLNKEYPLKYFYDFTEFKSQKQYKMLDKKSNDWDEYTKSDKKKSFKCSSCVFTQFCNGFWKEYEQTFSLDEIKPITKINNLNNLKF